MKYLVLALLLPFTWQSPAAAGEPAAATLREAVIVTEVLEWGETVTALRLEYNEELDCRAVEYSNEHPGRITYNLVNDRSIDQVYVNNSGNKDDVALRGRFVFLNLTIKNPDQTTYRDQVTFNTTSRHRDKISAFYGFQSEPLTTRQGRVIAANRFVTSREIVLGVDDFTTFSYPDQRSGKTLNYHLYIPKGHETKTAGARPLPLVVHFPSTDYAYTDSVGKHRGALFSHPDALFWTAAEAQVANPAFVVTVGGALDTTWTAPHAQSDMQQSYVKIVRKLLADYAIDATRVYAISLAGGSVPMWQTILANPGLFAAQISTAYDPYHAFRSAPVAEQQFATMLHAMPGWFFTGFTDGSGAGSLGPDDKRNKGERLRDISLLMNRQGIKMDVGYGADGELMWNGRLRGAGAEQLARTQLQRAAQQGARHLVTFFIPGTIARGTRRIQMRPCDIGFSSNATRRRSGYLRIAVSAIRWLAMKLSGWMSLTALGAIISSGTAAAAATDEALRFDAEKYTTVNVTIDGAPLELRRYRVVYVAKPIKMDLAAQSTMGPPGAAGGRMGGAPVTDPYAYQTMHIYVPQTAYDNPRAAARNSSCRAAAMD
jgi:predicted peptidase